MKTAEKLAKATAEIMSLVPRVDGIDIGELTAEDIKACLGMIKHKGAILLLEVKYLDMQTFKWDLFYELTHNVLFGMAHKEKWSKQKDYRTELVWDMCRLALDEHLTPGLCGQCNGRKTFYSNNLVVDCPKCGGTGKRAKNGQQALLCLSDRGWSIWRFRYRRILSILDDWEGTGIRKVAEWLKT